MSGVSRNTHDCGFWIMREVSRCLADVEVVKLKLMIGTSQGIVDTQNQANSQSISQKKCRRCAERFEVREGDSFEIKLCARSPPCDQGDRPPSPIILLRRLWMRLIPNAFDAGNGAEAFASTDLVIPSVKGGCRWVVVVQKVCDRDPENTCGISH